MPFLDVTNVLFNPAFLDSTLTVTRSTQTVGSNGLAVNTQTVTPFSGVVTAGRGSSLRREGEGSRIEGDIKISTTFALQDGRAGGDADVVAWTGRQYTVKDVKDYTTYGAGFVTAICVLVPLSGG